MDALYSLIRESLKRGPIGESKNFIWYITDVGIVALLREKNLSISSLNPIKEAIKLDLDLSKEEKQFIRIDDEQILLFYS